MKRTIFSGLVSGLMIISACADGKGETDDSAATNPTGATSTSAGTSSDSNSSTTGATDATASGTGTTGTTTNTTATGTTTNPTDPTDSGTDTDCTFLCMPDGGNDGTIECDIWAQDCPDGKKCMPWANDGGGAWNSTKCTDINPSPKGVGDPCTVDGSGVSGIDDCDISMMCWNVDAESNMGQCVAFCEGNEESCTANPGSCCGPGSACTIANSGVLILCLQTCDPIIQDCMGAGEVCYPVGNSFQCAPDVSGDMGAIGEPCEFINVCDPGTFCGNPGAYPGCDPMAGGCCIPFCELDAPECVQGTSCEPWYDPMDVPPGYENLGACVIPQ